MNELYNRLNSVNVNVYTQEKNKLTYLNWASAFRVLEQHVSTLEYRIVENNDGFPYWDTPLGVFVKTEMTVDGITKGMTLPVMDFTNAPMYSTPGKVIRFKKEVDRPVASSFDVNSSIMRCYVKNIAAFGLGNYIYEGMKAPETSNEVSAKVVDAEALEKARKVKLWNDFTKTMKKHDIVAKEFLEFNNIDMKDKEGLMYFVEDILADHKLEIARVDKYNKNKGA